MKVDTHMHTCFSDDSETPVETMIETAIARGISCIAITDHQDYGYQPGEFQIDPVRYLDTLAEMQARYAGRIRILRGVEIGMYLPEMDEIHAFLSGHSFDFVLGSLHLVDGIDPYERDAYPGTDEEMYTRYFEQTLECLQQINGIQALGHLDYIVRYGRERERAYSYQKFADVIDEILKVLIRKEIALEVNTGGYKSGIGFPNPHPDVLKRYRELGGKLVTYGADAHIPDYVGYEYDRAMDLIKDAGFEELTVFVDKKAEFIRLS